jgi:hypothetical protein
VGWWVGGVGEIERERRAGDFGGGGNSESETQTKLKRACSFFFFFNFFLLKGWLTQVGLTSPFCGQNADIMLLNSITRGSTTFGSATFGKLFET